MNMARGLFLGLLCAAGIETVAAQPYPVKPIRLIIPVTAGSSSIDILGRTLAQRVSYVLGQQVIVDNRPGANGNIGSELAAKSAPDGYTLLLGYTSSLGIGPSVYAKLGFDPIRDFEPIARFAVIPYMVNLHPSVPAANLKELIALAKARPGQLNYASASTGSLPHLCGELFKLLAGIDMTHVPYKAGAPAVVDLVGGHVQMYCTGITSVLPLILAGKVRGIATTTLNRSPLLPDVPTANESGLAGFDVVSWAGILAPANTPPPVIRQLYDAIALSVNAPDMKNYMLSQGAEPALLDPAQFGAYLKAEIAKWAKVVKAANVKAE